MRARSVGALILRRVGERVCTCARGEVRRYSTRRAKISRKWRLGESSTCNDPVTLRQTGGNRREGGGKGWKGAIRTGSDNVNVNTRKSVRA